MDRTLAFLRLFFLPFEFIDSWLSLSIFIVVVFVIATLISMIVNKIKYGD
jgi:hypothetical protein